MIRANPPTFEDALERIFDAKRVTRERGLPRERDVSGDDGNERSWRRRKWETTNAVLRAGSGFTNSTAKIGSGQTAIFGDAKPTRSRVAAS
jgi:hypothetical protein